MTRPVLRAAALAIAAAVAFPVAAAPAAPAAPAPKRAFTVDDVCRVKGVAEPAISPDGRSVAFSVTSTDLPAVKRWTNLWRVDADGKNGRALTVLDKRDASPAF